MLRFNIREFVEEHTIPSKPAIIYLSDLAARLKSKLSISQIVDDTFLPHYTLAGDGRFNASRCGHPLLGSFFGLF